MLFGVGGKHVFQTTHKLHNARDTQAVENGIAPFFIGNKPRIFQNTQVFGNCWCIRADHVGEFINTAFFFVKLLNDKESAGMRHRFDDFCPRLVLSFYWFFHFYYPENLFGNIAK